MKRFSLVLLSFLIVCPFFSFRAYALSSSDLSLIQNEANWIISLQNADGSFLLYNTNSPSNQISPYFSNIAAEGLVGRYGFSSNLDKVKNYMQWYFSHLNMPDKYGTYGTIYDYYVDSSGNVTTNQTYDSADSYAGTFISLVALYGENGGDETFLTQNRTNIEQIANVMVSLSDTDHLTIASKASPIKYLMDNTEVYKGLSDMSMIEQSVFHDSVKANYYSKLAYQSKISILTNFKNGDDYFYAINQSTYYPANLSTFYPDALSQVFPILNGVIPPSTLEAKKIYDKFNSNHPNWDTLQEADAFPWSSLGYLSNMMGDSTRANLFLQTVTNKYLSVSRPYPWNSAESGWIIKMISESGHYHLFEPPIKPPVHILPIKNPHSSQ